MIYFVDIVFIISLFHYLDSSVRGRRRGGRGRGTRGAQTIVTPRRTRQNIITPNMPQHSTLTDVYEFTDEDEKISQKYSKSPEPPVTSAIPLISSSPPSGALVVSTSPLTRKSRRLQVNHTNVLLIDVNLY